MVYVAGPVRMDDPNFGLLDTSLRFSVPELERTEYPQYKFSDPRNAGSGFVPLDPRQMPGARTITYYRVNTYGTWQPLSTYDTTGGESADFTLEPITYNTAYFGSHINYTIEELDAMAFANSNHNQQNGIAIDLVQEKLRGLYEGYYQLCDRMARTGSAENGIFGLLTHPDISRKNATSALGFATAADTNLAILNDACTTMVVGTFEVETPNTQILTTQAFQELSEQRTGSSSDKTVLRHHLDNSPHIRDMDSSPFLAGQSLLGTNLMITYKRDPEKLVQMIPKRIQILPPQLIGSTYRIYANAQVGGVHVKRPKSVLIYEGV